MAFIYTYPSIIFVNKDLYSLFHTPSLKPHCVGSLNATVPVHDLNHLNEPTTKPFVVVLEISRASHEVTTEKSFSSR